MSDDPRHVETQSAAAPATGGAPSAYEREAGDIVADKYELRRFLARGGMAEVWLGTHISLRTEVAIKFVDERLTRDSEAGPDALERFRFEAQISARLGAKTRHVVAVQDAGIADGVPYLVMEYVPGRTLDEEVQLGGPMAPARFADVLDQAADALGAAHALGIVHRDLKPSNVMLHDAPDGTLVVKIADFGVAKSLDTTLALDRPRDTQEGQLIGSPAFMSPEQLRCVAPVDARSDVWSLGVVAYETLTGQACFDGASVVDTFAAILSRTYRPPSSVQPDLPRGIDGWMARALGATPGERFASVSEMAQAFRALLAAAPPRPSRRPLALAALLAAAALGALLAASMRGKAPSVPSAEAASATAVARTTILAPSPTPVTPAEPAPIDVSKLPTVEKARAARGAQLPVPPAVTRAAPAAPATAAVTVPPAPATAPSTKPATHKGIDPSEIQ